MNDDIQNWDGYLILILLVCGPQHVGFQRTIWVISMQISLRSSGPFYHYIEMDLIWKLCMWSFQGVAFK